MLLAHKVYKVLKVYKEHKVDKVFKESKVLLVLKEHRVCRVLLVLSVDQTLKSCSTIMEPLVAAQI